jgi:hypothetical protein
MSSLVITLLSLLLCCGAPPPRTNSDQTEAIRKAGIKKARFNSGQDLAGEITVQYDRLGRKSREESRRNESRYMQYFNVLAVTDYEYDSLARIVRIDYSEAAEPGKPAFGYVATALEPRLHYRYRYRYDDLGRLMSTTSSTYSGDTTSIVERRYFERRIEEWTRHQGSTGFMTAMIRLDSLGREISCQHYNDAQGTLARYTECSYHGNGKLHVTTDAFKGEYESRHEYDSLGRHTRAYYYPTSHFGEREITWQYDVVTSDDGLTTTTIIRSNVQDEGGTVIEKRDQHGVVIERRGGPYRGWNLEVLERY